jgi:deoxyribodipyrimidine photo-lyase
MGKINIFWFRRDLRLNDNTALSKVLLNNNKTLPIFIFDENITDELDNDDARISFIYNQLKKIHNSLTDNYNSQLLILKGKPKDVINDLTVKYNIESFYTNDDYEPYSRKRDDKIESLLSNKGIKFKKFKDHVIFEKDEITKDDKNPM